MVVWWRELGEVENECISHNFSLFAIILPKNYENWFKFDEVLTKKTILHSFFETRCNVVKSLASQTVRECLIVTGFAVYHLEFSSHRIYSRCNADHTRRYIAGASRPQRLPHWLLFLQASTVCPNNNRRRRHLLANWSHNGPETRSVSPDVYAAPPKLHAVSK